MKILIAILLLLILFFVGCEQSPKEREYEDYKANRSVARICPHGEKIFKWNNKYWVNSPDRYPDMPVEGPEAC